ncbi:hypothetical protein GCM10007415_45510 [Parapedobacter pyrenivorans]|uniref:Uncharacterized protein n=2 Tax=Parapedobacter pyrenivorans TaxID=1305674 RepID=A0A917I2U3_9SPHI|nr:hypothetical protein GCM10007415_45510 [Parapedobacter pyrenivorans]
MENPKAKEVTRAKKTRVALKRIYPNKLDHRKVNLKEMQTDLHRKEGIVKFNIPDFTLLAAVPPDSLNGRVVIFHFPTHTVLELLEAQSPLLPSISPRYEWERINKYGEIDRFVFIVHRYVSDNLATVFEEAKDWYIHILDSFEESEDAMDELPSTWDKHSDDLPN